MWDRASNYSSLTLPPRTLVVIIIHVHLKGRSTEHTYEVKWNSLLMDQYPNVVIIPVISIPPMWTDTIIPFIVTNLSTESILLSKCEGLGYLDQTDTEVCKIMTSLGLEPLALEVTSEQPENPLPYREGQCICSPVHISVHRKVDLQDAEISENSWERFWDLCTRYSDIFSNDVEDFGHTDLVTMDIETGDSLPISQKPYKVSPKHTTWVQKKLETLEKAGIIVWSVSSWASPLVGVPKQTQPGKPQQRRLSMDYLALNNLLPLENKAHSRAKGVLTLVTFPKMNEMYAKLARSSIYSTLDLRNGYYYIAFSVDYQIKSTFVTPMEKFEFWKVLFN